MSDSINVNIVTILNIYYRSLGLKTSTVNNSLEWQEVGIVIFIEDVRCHTAVLQSDYESLLCPCKGFVSVQLFYCVFWCSSCIIGLVVVADLTVLRAFSVSRCSSHSLSKVELLSAPFTSQAPSSLRCLTMLALLQFKIFLEFAVIGCYVTTTTHSQFVYVPRRKAQNLESIVIVSLVQLLPTEL